MQSKSRHSCLTRLRARMRYAAPPCPTECFNADQTHTRTGTDTFHTSLHPQYEALDLNMVCNYQTRADGSMALRPLFGGIQASVAYACCSCSSYWRGCRRACLEPTACACRGTASSVPEPRSRLLRVRMATVMRRCSSVSSSSSSSYTIAERFMIAFVYSTHRPSRHRRGRRQIGLGTAR